MTEPATTPDDPFGQLRWDLADRLNKALRVGGCKPGEMATILGVSSGTITNYTSGRTEPKVGMIRQWALRCGVPVDWLVSGKCPPWDSNPQPADYVRHARIVAFPGTGRARIAA